MRNILLTAVILFCFQSICAKVVFVQQQEMSKSEKDYAALEKKQLVIEGKINELENKLKQNIAIINELQRKNKVISLSLDSMRNAHKVLEINQAKNNVEVNKQLQTTNNSLKENQSTLNDRTLLGIAIVVIIVISIFVVSNRLIRRIKTDSTTIDKVRKAQEALFSAQTKMQEESVKLDNKLLDIAEQQMKTFSTVDNQGEATSVDHSLTLKVADELTRIEMNLSRMDSSIKGYKQLSKAVQRIKNNFMANGYEIVDMLGKPYNEGMKVIANFVPDETLEPGKQIITGIIKPQINYNGKMIQSAQITVSQNI